MNVDNAKKEMKNETENVNTEISDDELEQAAGGTFFSINTYATCPICNAPHQQKPNQQNRTLYKCMNCGNMWLE